MKRYLSAEEIAEQLRREGDHNVSSRTVHYYAEQRLLPPPEYDGSRPRYTQTHLDAMRRVRALKRSGRTLDQVAEMLTPAAPAAQAGSAASGIARSGARAVLRGPKTIVVGRGLTLAVEGWTDDEIARIVQAIRAEVQALGRE